MNANQGETVIKGFHSETTESEVIQLLKEMINEIGMDFGSARIELSAPALQTPPKFHEKTPRETQKERNGGGKGKKCEILGGPAEEGRGQSR